MTPPSLLDRLLDALVSLLARIGLVEQTTYTIHGENYYTMRDDSERPDDHPRPTEDDR